MSWNSEQCLTHRFGSFPFCGKKGNIFPGFVFGAWNNLNQQSVISILLCTHAQPYYVCDQGREGLNFFFCPTPTGLIWNLEQNMEENGWKILPSLLLKVFLFAFCGFVCQVESALGKAALECPPEPCLQQHYITLFLQFVPHGFCFWLKISFISQQNRKNDEASYEKMLKLRREFSRAITILEMIKRREKTKRELLHLTLEVVEKR